MSRTRKIFLVIIGLTLTVILTAASILTCSMGSLFLRREPSQAVAVAIPATSTAVKTQVTPVKAGIPGYIVVNESMTWQDAKAYCEEVEGRHLATITSAEEQQVVVSLIRTAGAKKTYWLGGTQRKDGRWEWITGEKMSYMNWASGEPSSLSPEERYLMIIAKIPTMGFGSWDDNYNEGWNGDFTLDNIGTICETE